MPTKLIRRSDYEAITEEFSIYAAESGLDREYEYESIRDKAEFDFVSDRLETDDWEVVEDIKENQ